MLWNGLYCEKCYTNIPELNGKIRWLDFWNIMSGQNIIEISLLVAYKAKDGDNTVLHFGLLLDYKTSLILSNI